MAFLVVLNVNLFCNILLGKNEISPKKRLEVSIIFVFGIFITGKVRFLYKTSSSSTEMKMGKISTLNVLIEIIIKFIIKFGFFQK